MSHPHLPWGEVGRAAAGWVDFNERIAEPIVMASLCTFTSTRAFGATSPQGGGGGLEP